MAERTRVRIQDGPARTGADAALGDRSVLEGPQHRRNLRIAIQQLERAELYLVALYSLNLGDAGLEGEVDDLVRDLRGLRQHLVRSRLTA